MPSLKSEIRTVLGEAATVVIVGLGVGLTANQFSPRGLAFSRDYFPRGTNQITAVAEPIRPVPAPVQTNEPTEAAQISERLIEKGLQEIKLEQVKLLLRDPRSRHGRVIFVDARDEDHYQESHIPGAYELDPYHPEEKLGAVLPLCQAAEKVVVYCNGGDCEDSDTAAILLRDAGIPATKLFVYGGGFTEWLGRHLPIETAAKNGGTESNPK